MIVVNDDHDWLHARLLNRGRLGRGRELFGFALWRFSGKNDAEGRAFAEFALHGDVAAHQLAKFPADGQPQSGAAIFARRGSVRLTERLEEPTQLLRRQADAAVGDIKFQPVRCAIFFVEARDIQFDNALRGKFARVAQKIEKGLAHFGQVGAH